MIDSPRRADEWTVAYLHDALARLRADEDIYGARAVLAPTRAQLGVITQVGRQARDPARSEMLRLASQYAQFLGWMYSDLGLPAEASQQYHRAMRWAQEPGDPNMVASILSLRSHGAWTARDATRSINFAQASQNEPRKVTPGVLALAVQQEARGHALDGQQDETDGCLDRAEQLTARAAAHPEDEPAWVYFAAPTRFMAQRAIAHIELGRPTEAADLLTAVLRDLPASYRSDHGRYGALLALAHAQAGDIPQACAAGRHAATIAAETGSRHAMTGPRRARRHLTRAENTAAVRDFDVYLRELLSGR